MKCGSVAALIGAGALALAAGARAADPAHPLLEWVKRHPLPGAARPSPRMGYETSMAYDPASRLIIRWGGHNQGGGGEQNAETWTYDLDSDTWTLKEPNDAPPGVCCAQQNVFDEAGGRFVRFPAFSGSHGWQSFREINLKNSAVWTYDPATNTWRDMRPCPSPRICPLRGAAYDADYQVTVIHGGEGANHGTLVYDLYTNTVHEMKPAGPAPENSLSQPGFTYDAVHKVFVLFGSQFGTDDRTWLYDLRTNAWRVLEVKGERPPAREQESSPVLAADTRSGIVLCNIRNRREADRLETWALDVAKAEWRRLTVGREPDPSGSRNRVMLYLADRNLFVMENATSGHDGQPREQQVWTFRYAEAPAPSPPFRLLVTTEKDAAILEWDAPPRKPDAAWHIYRSGADDKPWQIHWGKVSAASGSPFKDAGLKPGATYFYQVRQGADGAANAARSYIARTQPPVVVGAVASVISPRRVELTWERSPAPDVAGYHVERAEVSVLSAEQVRRIRERYRQASDVAAGAVRAIGPFTRLTPAPLAQTNYVDESLDLTGGQKGLAAPPIDERRFYPDQLAEGRPYRFAAYAYRVIAVNRLGVESGPSPLVFTWPSAVQHVFCKEEGTVAARLRWRANPEKGIRGYLVYRHDGRYDKEPITRLTPEPIAATEFVDPESGKGTRRYEVVAVDALGQEGEPSQPVWARREWARFYAPYVGEWHQ